LGRQLGRGGPDRLEPGLDGGHHGLLALAGRGQDLVLRGDASHVMVSFISLIVQTIPSMIEMSSRALDVHSTRAAGAAPEALSGTGRPASGTTTAAGWTGSGRRACGAVPPVRRPGRSGSRWRCPGP